MLYTYKAKVTSGGVVMPYYHSSPTISVNAESPQEAYDKAELRARQVVARDLCMSIGLVKVTSLQIVNIE